MQYTQTIYVTPEKAMELLSTNSPRNRNVKKMYVQTLAEAMRRGKFLLTHQGIAISVNGELIDGQHRLLAIIESGVTVKMQVTYGVEENAFLAMDCGARRTLGDALAVPKRVIEVSAFVTRLVVGRGRVTPTQVKFVHDNYIGDIAEALVNYCCKTTKYISSAPVKAAAALTVKFGISDQSYVFDSYRRLILMKTETMTPVEHAFNRQMMTQGRRNDFDSFARGMVVFDETKMWNNKIQIMDLPATIMAARKKCSELSALLSVAA